MKHSKFPAILVIISSVLGCQSIKEKGETHIQKVKVEIKERKEEMLDNLIPRFDSYKPDTKFNRIRFSEFFGFTPTDDIKELYCFADQMGIDSKFFFAFTCRDSTKVKIVERLNMKRSEEVDNISTGLWPGFQWWDSLTISSIKPYTYNGSHEYHRYLWYDSVKNKLYYCDYDL